MRPNVAVLDWRGFHFCLAFSWQRTSSNLVSSYFTNYDLVHTDDPKLPAVTSGFAGSDPFTSECELRAATPWCARSGYNSAARQTRSKVIDMTVSCR
jgi:hypothetical protein